VFQAIALFNANRHKESLLRVEQLFADPSTDSLTCGVVVVSHLRRHYIHHLNLVLSSYSLDLIY
jgi:hypothetical protein